VTVHYPAVPEIDAELAVLQRYHHLAMTVIVLNYRISVAQRILHA
jgi:hypothetical protein